MAIFDHANEKANAWIKDMMRELGTDDPRQAYHALCASLHFLRDRLSVNEAAQLAAQLPLLVRGLFYEGWHPAATPTHERRPKDVLASMHKQLGDGEAVDPERALAATLEVLREHVAAGELSSLAQVLPRSLGELVR
jgi:uncharacterized protein (DUF2267 family)